MLHNAITKQSTSSQIALYQSLPFVSAYLCDKMASSKINAAIAALIEETQVATIDKMVAFLSEKIEVDEDMQKMFEDFKESIKGSAKADLKKATKKSKKSSDEDSGDEKKKRTRAPSAYNLYIKEKMAEFKEAGHKGNLMKMAIEAWNEDKAACKVGKEDVVEKPAVEEEVVVEKKDEVNEDEELKVKEAPKKKGRKPKAASSKYESDSE